ncbi:MAG TPA: hypothetical protein VI794_00635 [Patescibacteria group bacterium]|nr:hypothetical protein [Patescibacteria group bacterium]
MRTQTREKLFSLFTSLTLLSQYVIGIFSYLPVPVYADGDDLSSNVDLDQMRNGSAALPNVPPIWFNGNAGGSNSHLIEGYSQSYRAVLTDLPIGEPITLTIGYDIKHSGAHAIDFLTQYQRLEDHGYFGHLTETVDPTDGVVGVTDGSAPSSTFAIPAPSSAGSPVFGQPTTSFNALPAGERVMSMWNGAISSMAYNTQGDLADDAAETTIDITFSATNSTAILAWGGHLGSKLDWGIGNSAGGIHGSPYHMRLISWYADVNDDGDDDLGNLGATDKSLSADAVVSPATVTVVKDVVPDDSSTWDFNLELSSDSSLVGTASNIIDGGDYTFGNLTPDSYTLSEVTSSSYSTSVACLDEDGDPIGTGSNDSVVLPLPEGEDVTCTFTNEINPGSITVDKITIPSGSNQSFDFTLSGAGSTSLIDEQTPHTFPDLLPGNYSLIEYPVTGWAPISAVCSDGVNNEINPNSIDLTAGGDITCTFTNGQLPTLTVYKELPNDNGGTATEDNFDLYINDVLRVWETTYTLEVGSQSFEEDFLEIDPSGYLVTFSEGCEDGNVSLAYGDEKTCTITNDDVAPTLTLVKTVTNNDGGQANENQWTLQATGTDGFSGSGPTVGPQAVLAGEPYTLSESGGPSGYTPSDWQCDGGQLNGNVITLGLAEDVTCTIVNDDEEATLILAKILPNDNGGTATENDFNVYIDAVQSSWGSHQVDAGTYTVSEDTLPGYTPFSWGGDCNAQGEVALLPGETMTCTILNDDETSTLTLVKVLPNDDGGTATENDFSVYIDAVQSSWGSHFVDAGSYTVSEDTLFGYAPSTWGEDCDAQGNITLLPGESKTCTITNDDQPGTLIVKKIVVNDNGGDANGSDFYFQVNGLEPGPFLDDGALKEIPVPQGTYTVTEESADGYGTSYDNCSEVFIPNGGSETCTVTNDDTAPTITLYKEVINLDGGTAGPNDFGLTIGDTAVTSGQTLEVDANTPYALNEAGLFGYAFVSLTGGEEREDDCPSVLGGTVTLNEGENISCTITNDDIAPKLTVIKRVVNNSTGTKIASDFTLSIAATNPDPIAFFGNEGGTVIDLDAGQYEVTEEPVAGYTAFYSEDCVGDIKVGEEKTCTVTNNDQDVLGEEDEGEVLPATGMPLVNLLFAALAFEVGLYLRRRSRRA